MTLHTGYLDRLKHDGAPAALFRVIDQLFELPAVNVTELIQRLGVSKPTAGSYIKRLEKLDILREQTGRERDRDWIAPEIVRIIEIEAPHT
ncbi:MAG: MarR family transcriptional regulator [Planctomycetaceae bacterium]